MPDCIYRLTHLNKSICVRTPTHLLPCLGKSCCSNLSHDDIPQFKPAMKIKMKFWIQTKDPQVLQDPRIQLLRNYPHLGLVEIISTEEDVVKIAAEKGINTQHISKSAPYHVVRF